MSSSSSSSSSSSDDHNNQQQQQQEQQQQQPNTTTITSSSILLLLTSPQVNNPQVIQQLQHNPHAALAFILHLLMLQRGFRLVGLSENDPVRELSNDNDNLIPPEGWNKNSDVYSFKYKHSQSAMTFVLKCVPLGDRLLIHAMAIEDKKPHGLEMNVNDYINRDELNRQQQQGESSSSSSPNMVDIYKQLDNIETFFKLNIMNKLVPFLNKEGYETENTAPSTSFTYGSSSSSSSSSSTSSSSGGGGSSTDNHPTRPHLPPSTRVRLEEDDEDNDNNDPLRIGPPLRAPRYSPLMDPYDIGRSDLYPDVGAPYFRGGPASGFPGPFGGGGSMVGPRHPMFGGGGIGGIGGGGGGGGMGIPRPGFGPRQPGMPPSVPTGARFDPYGPPGTGRGVPGPAPNGLRPPRFEDEDENPYFF